MDEYHKNVKHIFFPLSLIGPSALLGPGGLNLGKAEAEMIVTALTINPKAPVEQHHAITEPDVQTDVKRPSSALLPKPVQLSKTNDDQQ